MEYDPNAAAKPGAGIWGLPHSEQDAAVVLVPVPWEATTSYGGGTANGPQAILKASPQIDVFDLDVERPYAHGMHMLPLPAEVMAWNETAKAEAAPIIGRGYRADDPSDVERLGRVNALSEKVNAHVEREVTRLARANKIVGVVGGDHSVPYGAFVAMAKLLGSPFGILHFDAHSDTRKAYEGFTHSHASIMYNALEGVPAIEKLVQVGIRDLCEAEMEYCAAQGQRVSVFFDRELSERKMDGEPFAAIARQIAAALPDHVWVSFDIDGLDPRYCPHTGTPVPGGLEFNEAIAILREVVRAKKRIVGFDLCEVAPNPSNENDEWDGNVGSRLLYKLAAFTLASQGRAQIRER